MRRIINRTRRSRSGLNMNSNYNRNRYNNNQDNQSPTEILENTSSQQSRTGKKKSPIASFSVIVVVAAIIGGIFWFGSKTDDKARLEGPEAVVNNVVAALGVNNEGSAKNYVQENDSAVLNQLASLFDNYDQYFTFDDDYIKWSNIVYTQKNISNTEATIDVSGKAEIVEVEVEIYENYDGEEMEELTEIVVDEFDFSNATFSLTKVGEEWFLSDIPNKLF